MYKNKKKHIKQTLPPESCKHRDCFYSSFCRSLAVQYGWCKPRNPNADDVSSSTGCTSGHGRLRYGNQRQWLRLASLQWLHGLRYSSGKYSSSPKVMNYQLVLLPLLLMLCSIYYVLLCTAYVVFFRIHTVDLMHYLIYLKWIGLLFEAF